MTVIRSYDPADASELIKLWREVLPPNAPHNDPETSLRNKLTVCDDLLLVAVDKDAVVGAVMGGYDGHRGWVYSLAVSESHRRCGIGTQLVRELEARLVQKGCLKINLQVRMTNAAVVAFYEQLGYHVEENLSLGKRTYEL